MSFLLIKLKKNLQRETAKLVTIFLSKYLFLNNFLCQEKMNIYHERNFNLTQTLLQRMIIFQLL